MHQTKPILVRLAGILAKSSGSPRSLQRLTLVCSALLVQLLISGCLSDDQINSSLQCDNCNLIIVSVDTLRADRLSAYGYERTTSPFLDGLATQGYLFEDFFHNGGGTLPSHLTMLTSLSPITHGSNPRNPIPLSPNADTLAEVLKTHGYATFGITDGGWMDAKFGFDRGFDRFHVKDNQHLANSMPRFKEWINQTREKPFFGFLHTYDVHSKPTGIPYGCPSEGLPSFSDWYQGPFEGCIDGKCASRLLGWVNAQVKEAQADPVELLGEQVVQYLSDRYDECIAYVDSQLAELVEFLESDGRWSNTILVVTSDHGEEFLDHGMLLHDQGGYQELSKIPLIIRVPGGKGHRVEGLSAMIDVVPTLLELLGLEELPQAEGQSLVPSMRDERPTGRRFVHMYSVLRSSRWLFFRNLDRLFDSVADPAERVNLYDANPDLVGRLTAAVNQIVKHDRAHRERLQSGNAENLGPVELNPAEIEALKSLGYLN